MKDIFCIVADGRICHVVKKEYLEESLSAWKETYKDAAAVPAEKVIDTSKPVIGQVQELFRKMECFYEIWEQDGSIYIDIHHGDWKHDHENADYIMETAFGIKVKDETVTEESDEDAYSAIHTYALPKTRRRKTAASKRTAG